MPYYWPKPVYHALVKLAGKLGKDDLDEMVVDVLTEKCRMEGVFKNPKECMHPEEVLYKSRKVLMCTECGMSFESEFIYKQIVNTKKALLHRIQENCSHEFVIEGDMMVCRKCGLKKDTPEDWKQKSNPF